MFAALWVCSTLTRLVLAGLLRINPVSAQEHVHSRNHVAMEILGLGFPVDIGHLANVVIGLDQA